MSSWIFFKALCCWSLCPQFDGSLELLYGNSRPRTLANYLYVHDPGFWSAQMFFSSTLGRGSVFFLLYTLLFASLRASQESAAGVPLWVLCAPPRGRVRRLLPGPAPCSLPLYPSTLHKHFIKALYTSTLSKHFTQALCRSTLHKHFTQALYTSTLSRYF